jgi:hypothetical protein
VLLFIWLLISGLLASLRSDGSLLDLLMRMLPSFVFGGLLIAFFAGLERRPAERDVVVMRRDLFGQVDKIEKKSYWSFPGFMYVQARIPSYPLKVEFDVETVDTQTAKLLRIEHMRVRCNYTITDYKRCMDRVLDMSERLRDIERAEQLRPTDPSLWRNVLGGAITGMVDDKLREVVWNWVNVAMLRAQQAGQPIAMPVQNDPYALSLVRSDLADEIARSINDEAAKGWGIRLSRLVFEHVRVDPELISKRTRDLQKEKDEAQHQAELDFIAIRARGMAEAGVRARTVKLILKELSPGGLPNLDPQTLAQIVRAAMYSDGEMIWKGVLEKSVSGTQPGTAKTA